MPKNIRNVIIKKVNLIITLLNLKQTEIKEPTPLNYAISQYCDARDIFNRTTDPVIIDKSILLMNNLEHHITKIVFGKEEYDYMDIEPYFTILYTKYINKYSF